MSFRNTEEEKLNIINTEKPYVHEKMRKFNEKLANGESIAIIQLQYNYVCNFKCDHCSIKGFQGKTTGKRRLNPEDIKNIAKQADELGLGRFVISGGEPLVFKDLEEIVKAIDPDKFYINMDTNGWFLDDEKAKYLKKIGIDRIQLSIDSLNAEEHDEFRKMKGSHERAMKAIDSARKAGLGIFIQTVVWKQRLRSEEFLEFVNYFNNMGITVYVSYAKPVGVWEGCYDGLVDREDMAYMEELEKTHNLCTHLTPAYDRNMGCIAVKGILSITEYGDVLPCPFIHTSIGNVFDQSLKDIIDKGLSIKFFGEYVDTCSIAEDRDFIDKYIAGRVYGKPLPVHCDEVFTEEDKTKIPFNETMIKENKVTVWKQSE